MKVAAISPITLTHTSRIQLKARHVSRFSSYVVLSVPDAVPLKSHPRVQLKIAFICTYRRETTRRTNNMEDEKDVVVPNGEDLPAHFVPQRQSTNHINACMKCNKQQKDAHDARRHAKGCVAFKFLRCGDNCVSIFEKDKVKDWEEHRKTCPKHQLLVAEERRRAAAKKNRRAARAQAQAY